MQPETMTQPVALPRDAKPSEILESQPRWKWKAGSARWWRMCRVEWLARRAGLPQRNRRIPISAIPGYHRRLCEAVAEYYGVPQAVIDDVFLSNDRPDLYGMSDGYTASLEILKAAGY